MSEDIKIRFLFSRESIGKRLKWKDIKMLRRLQPGGEFDEAIQTLACRFMADDNNEYLPLEQAYAIFDELSQEESLDAINKFVAVFQESTIPNASRSQSETTSEASSLTPISPTSPTGSQT